MALVLLGEQEPDKLGVGHAALLLGAASGHRAREDPLDHASAQGWNIIGNKYNVSAIPIRACPVGCFCPNIVSC